MCESYVINLFLPSTTGSRERGDRGSGVTQSPGGTQGHPAPCQALAVFSVNLPQFPVDIPDPQAGLGVWVLPPCVSCATHRSCPVFLSWALTALPAANQELHLLKQLHSLERDSRFQTSELQILPFPMFSSLSMFLSPRVSQS